MERDLGVHILSYVHDEDMMRVANTNRYLGDKVWEARNTEERYLLISKTRTKMC